MAKKSRPNPSDVPGDGGVVASSGVHGSNGTGRFKSSVLLGAMLFAPAAFLVLRGNLSVNEALIRFGCALLFAMVGTALVIATMPAAGGSFAPGAEGDVAGSPEPVGGPVPGVPVTQPVG